jgi:hypothetical protein
LPNPLETFGQNVQQEPANKLKLSLSVVGVPSGRQPDQLSREEMESILLESHMAPGA